MMLKIDMREEGKAGKVGNKCCERGKANLEGSSKEQAPMGGKSPRIKAGTTSR
jgi:hypothetical protein